MHPREGKRVGITGDISILLRFYSPEHDERGEEVRQGAEGRRSAMQIGLNSSTKREVPVSPALHVSLFASARDAASLMRATSPDGFFSARNNRRITHGGGILKIIRPPVGEKQAFPIRRVVPGRKSVQLMKPSRLRTRAPECKLRLSCVGFDGKSKMRNGVGSKSGRFIGAPSPLSFSSSMCRTDPPRLPGTCRMIRRSVMKAC